MKISNDKILRVPRTKEQAKRAYDKISRIYDLVAGTFERKFSYTALEKLNVGEGEIVLEAGFGTGHCLVELAKRVGNMGRAYGVDISPRMLEITRKRLEKESLIERVKLFCGDAMSLPYEENKFDAVFMSFTLELFDTPEIPLMLKEAKRVLKQKGRLAVVGMSREDGGNLLLRAYEWIHRKLPAIADCRPIYVEQSIKDAGFRIKFKQKIIFFGMPGEIVIGLNES